ncbi:MAG: hypothetical protein M3P43_04810 [Actinomycetota bacterium]|nr:hypothetical protein [Actinomycetota bacterium]
MPRWVKLTLWLGVFGVCAAGGAFVAAHTDPFPPGVEDPGARSTTTGSPSLPPTNGRWRLVMTSETRHQFHVGGACRTSWQTRGSLTISPDGATSGLATARLVGNARCDFPVAQIQSRQIRLVLTYSLSGGVLHLAFRDAGRDPVGSQDLGGFTNTIRLIRPAVRLEDGAGHFRQRASRPDGDLGRYVSDNQLLLECASGC